MKYKAKATGVKTRNRQYSTFVEYEYRGHKYEVEYSNSWTYCVTSPKVQHESAQRNIDKMIDRLDTKKSSETAEEGFELFWRYVNGEE